MGGNVRCLACGKQFGAPRHVGEDPIRELWPLPGTTKAGADGALATSAPPLQGPKIEYRVVPFVANVSLNSTSADAAAQLEKLVQHWADRGWEYVRLESLETHVEGSRGCFGLGAVPPKVVSLSMVVFKK